MIMPKDFEQFNIKTFNIAENHISKGTFLEASEAIG